MNTNESPLKISIITVSFNSAETIEQTIKSVLEQDYENYEYIIIDGGSTDGTVDIIEKYADDLAYFVSEPDNGLYDAMNKGIHQARGRYHRNYQFRRLLLPQSVQARGPRLSRT